MSCKTGVFQVNAQGLYECSTTLTGLKDRVDNNFYFSCKDQPHLARTANESKRNVNEEGYSYRLIGTVPLEITSVPPQSGTLYNPSPLVRVITARGAQGGNALCGYNFLDPNPLNAIDFARTNSTVHEQQFTNLTTGNYNMHINCIDLGGNLANSSISFNIQADTQGPRIAQLYVEGTILHIITDEPSTCEYSTTGSFAFGSGTLMTGSNIEEHEATLDSNIYYVTCQDSFNNRASYVVYV